MDGALGQLYEDWRKRLIHMRAMIEADFDFADEEDVPGSVADEVWAQAARVYAEIADHLEKVQKRRTPAQRTAGGADGGRPTPASRASSTRSPGGTLPSSPKKPERRGM
ncbi:hypothetical protein QW131_23610 [Roseibium salinum]|nr:hypothetical protein [Roseibium salinum]